MIDFRYHLVSLVAVFLALAVGIVLGTTALNGPLTRTLQHAEANLRSTADDLRAQNRLQASRLSGDASFVTAAAPRLLGGLLTGERVVLVTAPGADGSVVTGVTTAIHQSGATVAGQIGLNQQFFDTSATTESSLAALAQQLAPAGTVVTAGTTQQGGDPQLAGQSEASAVLAAALLNREPGAVPPAQSRSILAGFAQQGYLQATPDTISAATMAVVIAPAAPSASGNGDPANTALLALTEKLNAAGRGTVLAGSFPAGSGPGSAIDELTSGDTGIKVSSVDNANYETGQITVIYALSDLLAGHEPAPYGNSAVPSPLPAPSPSASPSPTSSGQATAKRNKKHHAGTGKRPAGRRSPTPHPSAGAGAAAGASR
jgi:Copper transport outer membrane protein, MctB